MKSLVRVAHPSTAASHSGKVLDIAGGDTANGARIIRYGRHGGTSRRLEFINLGDGTYRKLCLHSGLHLDAAG